MLRWSLPTYFFKSPITGSLAHFGGRNFGEEERDSPLIGEGCHSVYSVLLLGLCAGVMASL